MQRHDYGELDVGTLWCRRCGVAAIGKESESGNTKSLYYYFPGCGSPSKFEPPCFTRKITLPQVINKFADYHDRNPTWGSLHVVLDDGNYDDSTVEFCIGYAQEVKDDVGEYLARTLLILSKTQRRKISASI